MNKFDELDESIDKLLSIVNDITFVINGKWKCKTKGHDESLEWKKDTNSPAFLAELSVDVESGDKSFDGIVVVQDDKSLSNRHYASLCIKDRSSTEWQQMVTVVGISFN